MPCWLFCGKKHFWVPIYWYKKIELKQNVIFEKNSDAWLKNKNGRLEINWILRLSEKPPETFSNLVIVINCYCRLFKGFKSNLHRKTMKAFDMRWVVWSANEFRSDLVAGGIGKVFYCLYLKPSYRKIQQNLSACLTFVYIRTKIEHWFFLSLGVIETKTFHWISNEVSAFERKRFVVKFWVQTGTLLER